jgi:integrase
MSIEKTPRGDYRVRWREAGSNRAKVIGPRKTDAVAFEREILRAKRFGSLAELSMGEMTLAEFGPDWWSRHARRRAKKTQKNYAWAWDTYIAPRFGRYRLREITAADVEEWLADLEDDAVGVEARRKALKLLKQVLNAAVRWSELARNPIALVDPPPSRPEPVVPPSPIDVEQIRVRLLDRRRLGDATLVSVMAYAGLRPHEVWPLTWGDVRERTILIRTRRKVGANTRTVPLLAPLARDLAEWRLATGGRSALVLPNAEGREWTSTTFNNWRRRVWRGSKENPGVAPTGMRPYALRHTFCSLLIREGCSVVEVARRAGNSPELCLRTYGHLFDELPGSGSAEGAIRAARSEVHRRETVPADG